MATGYGMYFVVTVLALLPAMMIYVLLTPRLRARAMST
jgi:PAT family beta-lactamase induction signal transducer AmpG